MRKLTSVLLGAVAVWILSMPAAAQEGGRRGEGNADVQRLHTMIKKARADLKALRAQLGLRGEKRGEHREGSREGRGEHRERSREGRGEHGERSREGRGERGERNREGRGEHGERRRGGRGEHGERGERGREGGGERGERGEESGKRLTRTQKWDAVRRGARLVLAYDSASQSFKGVVVNLTAKVLPAVRVEVHLSNGVELGPTKRTDLKPGERIAVELSAAGQEFTWWTTHPESGKEAGHGPGHESKGGGEHGARRENRRPRNPALRPLYNQIRLLQREIRTIARELRARKR